MISEDTGWRSGRTRPGDLMVWLGGGNQRDVDEPAERAGYQATGLVVLLGALTAWGVSAGALVVVGALAPLTALVVTLLLGLLVGVQGRVVAAVRAGGRPGLCMALTAAVLGGVLLGELAALLLFAGSLGPQLDARADRDAAAVVDAGVRRLVDLRADRDGLDRRVDQATTRRAEALVVARCEYRPAPGCPRSLITGEPGRGPEAEQARLALAGADADLDAARTDRERRAATLDRDIAAVAARVELDRDSAAGRAREDGGLVAHWGAMNDYAAAHPATWLLRLGTITALALLLAAPLLLRLWHGPTEHDHIVDARRRRRRAEREADTAIAIRRAEARATHELELLDADLSAMLHADPLALDAAVPGPPALDPAESGPAVPGPAGSGPAVSGPAGSGRTMSGELVPTAPAAVSPAAGSGQAPAATRQLLDLLPGPLPMIGRSVGGIAGAFVPAPVSRIMSNRPRPLRMARTVWDEVEELQFSVLRRRRVTVTHEPGADHGAGPEAATTMTAEYLESDGRSTPRLGHGGDGAEMSLERARRELPAAD